MKRDAYERRLEPMLLELNNLARWLAITGNRTVVLLEGQTLAACCSSTGWPWTRPSRKPASRNAPTPPR